MQSILLISKNRPLIQMLGIFLAQHSFVVRAEKSFNEAFEEMKRRGHYDMVLSLEDRSRQSATDLQRMVSKICPYSRFVNLAGIAPREGTERGSRLDGNSGMDSADVMDVIEEVLRIAMDLKSQPMMPTEDELKTSLYNTAYLLTSVLNYQGIINAARFQEIISNSIVVAKRLGFPQRMLDEIAFSALLKDIGMIKIDPAIKDQPRRLTSDEFSVLKKHCVHGVNIIMKLKLPWELKDNILCHHERFDGSGYPLGLQKHDIPIGARIISTVDAYFAMTSDRPHRTAMSKADALDEIRKNLGSQFDPEIGRELLSAIEPNEKAAAPGARQAHRIAVIDDLEATREELVERLAKLGYAPFGLSGSHSALEYLRLNRVDVILCATSMSGADGLQLLHWIKQLPDLESTPFVLISQMKQAAADVVMGLEMGADDYLFQPIEDHHLQSRLEGLLARGPRSTRKDIVTEPGKEERNMRLIKLFLRLKEDDATGMLVMREIAGGESGGSDSAGREASVFFIRGHVRHAVCGDATGEEAFYTSLAFERFEDRFDEGKIPHESTITKGLEYMLIEGLRRQDNKPEDMVFEFQLA